LDWNGFFKLQKGQFAGRSVPKRRLFVMWVVVSIAKDKAAAEKAKKILDNEGILVDLRPITKKMELGTYEILVLESEALEASDILSDSGIL